MLDVLLMDAAFAFAVDAWAAAAAPGLCPYLVRGRTVPAPADAVLDGRALRAAGRQHSAAQRPPLRKLADGARVPGRQEKTEYLSVQQ
uniref:Putative secreted protein n=1 Tax=Anopheles triannulatus TaxID=58253 RepID=A0A2M4B1A4_9DIPT